MTSFYSGIGLIVPKIFLLRTMEPLRALQVARFSSLLLWPRCCAASNPRPHHLLPSSRAFVDRVHSNASSISAPRAKPHPFSSYSCSAAGASPPPPPPGEDQNFVSGLQSTLSRIQDRVRIFFAVLFWMSLFFWGSAWDGSNSAKKKGPWFRK